LVQGGAARWGTEPALWYVQTLFSRAPWGLALLTALGLAGLRVTWPHMLTAALAVAYLSTQPHKEERFVLIVWPFLIIAASGAAGHWLWRLRRTRLAGMRALPMGLALLLAGSIVWDGELHLPPPNAVSRKLMDCERWAGARLDTTGLMIAVPWSNLAGALWYGLRVPIALYTPPIARNPLFNYAIVREGSHPDRVLASTGFHTVYASGEYRVRKRAAELPGAKPRPLP
jgi:hypothetical protein